MAGMFFSMAQRIVLQTNRIFPCKFLYTCIYVICRQIVIWRFSRIPQVTAIYARGGTFGDTETPGDSDIDLVVVTSRQDYKQEDDFLEKFTREWFFLSKIIPFFHVRVLAHEDFALYFSLKQLQLWKPFNFKLEHVFGERFSIPVCNIAVGQKTLLALIVRRYRDFLQELFIVPDKKRIRHLVKYADYIVRWSEDVCPGNFPSALSQARQMISAARKSSYCVKNNLSFSAELWLAIDETIRRLCADRYSLDMMDNAPVFARLAVTKYTASQQTRNTVCSKARKLAEAMAPENDSIKSIVISSNISSNYQYFLYVVLRDDAGLGDRRKVEAWFMRFYNNIRGALSHYLAENSMILSQSCFGYCLRQGLLPGGYLESLNIARNSSVIYGRDIVEGAREDVINRGVFLSQWDFANNIVLSAPIASDPYRNMLGLRRENAGLIINSLDNILSVLPARRIMLQRHIVTTTPEETYREYMGLFSDEPQTRLFKDLYARFCTDMPEKIDLAAVRDNLSVFRGFTRFLFSEIKASIRKVAAESNIV